MDQTPQPRAGRSLAVLAGVLLVAWPLGPWLGFFGFITGVAFFGERPSDAEQSQAALLMLAGAAISWGFPAIVLLIARGRRLLRRTAVLQLVVATVALPVILVITQLA